MATHQNAPDGLSGLTELMQDEYALRDVDIQLERDVRRSRRRRGWLIVGIVFVVICTAIGGYVTWALTAPVSAPSVTWHSPEVVAPGPVAIALPVGGASAISVSGGDQYLGAEASGMWLSSGADEPRSIASISKLITALVILEAKPLASAEDPGPMITFDKADHDLYDKYYVLGATIAAMPTGTTLSERDALATMLIPSASNYAEAMATWAFGSQGAFVDATREWLAAHGLTGTTIIEPTGISYRNVSTPSDLLAIGKLAAAHPAIAEIVATPALSLPGPGQMYNTNDLLGSNGITGLKTGNLGPGSYSLLYTASLDVGAPEPLQVTGVMVGGHSRDSVNASVLTLFDSIRSGFRRVPVAELGQVVGSYSTPWGSTAQVVIAADADIFTWSDTPITMQMEPATPSSFTDGEEAGSITWTAGPNSATATMEVAGAIVPPTAWWRLTHPSELGGH